MKFALGIDFGTQSGRAVVADVRSGDIYASAARAYPSGIFHDALPSGKRLPPDWALQDPADTLWVLEQVVRQAVAEAGVSKEDIVGLAVDATSCSVLPILQDGTPLCHVAGWEDEPHAYLKMWKHHGAQQDANLLNQVALARGERFLARYGGKISSEALFPKLMQTLREAPAVFEAAHRFIDLGDWLTLLMTGKERRSACMAGYKALWHKREGYPDKDFLGALHPGLRDVVDTKLGRGVYPVGSKAGGLTEAMAERLGLCPGTAVGVATIDAHVSLPAVGITQPGDMLMIMGTSTCHITLGREEKIVPGMCGAVEDGVVPGFWAYEAGQSCVGDHFAWFAEHCVPPAYWDEAKEKGLRIYELLGEKAKRQKPGAHGLVALDWWNGNRSVLADADLTGLMLGLTLQTRPEDLYRALIEATAYGTRRIIEAFADAHVPVTRLFACGGIPEKDAFLMQLYADVTGREIFLSDSPQTVALGAAMLGAVAAGRENGGYDSIFEAAKAMAKVRPEPYRPCPASARVYDALYKEYRLLHDYFGAGGSEVMKRLKKIRTEAAQC